MIYRSMYKSAMNKAKYIFYQDKINEFSRSPRHLFKLTSSQMVTKGIYSITYDSYFLRKEISLFSKYDINVFSLPLSFFFTSCFSTSLTDILYLLNAVKSTSSINLIPLTV